MSIDLNLSKAPVGATHYREDWHCSSTGGIQYYKLDRAGWQYWGECLHKGWRECEKPVFPVLKLHQTPAKPDARWTGEGLPPVGTVCEFAGGTHCPEDPFDKDLKEGMKVTIIAHFKCGDFTLAAFTFDPENPDRGMVQVEQANFGCFRPIRTPEQIAAEERRKACEELLSDCYQDANAFALVQAGRLYDAGWRKQVTP